MAQSLKKNLVYNILINLSSVIFPFITAPYVARVLEPEGVGLFNFANTYAGYFALVAALGIPTYGVREVAKVRDDREKLQTLVSQLISINVLTTIIVTIIYLLSIAFIGQLNENYIIFIVAGIVLYMAPFKTNWFFNGLENFGFLTLRTLAMRVLSLVALFMFVHKKDDLIIYIIIYVLSAVLGDIWNYVMMINNNARPRFTLRGLKQHLNPLFVLFSSAIAISIYTILDTLMIGFISEYSQVGYYNSASHISKAILAAVTSLSAVAIPRISHYLKNGETEKINELVNKSFYFVSFLAFPISIGIFCIAPVFVPLFFGEEFYGAIVPLQILGFLIVAIGLNNLSGVQILIGMGYDKLFLYSVLVGTFVNFSLNSVLIYYMGAVGASIASIAAEIIILFVTTVYVYKKTSIRINNIKDIAISFAGSLILFPVFWGLSMVLDNWMLVIAFTLLGGLSYIAIEYGLKSSSLKMLIDVLMYKLKKNESNIK